ncbi:MAG: DUF1573 domain-containing protein [Bacteroidetes bacterium]|nr:DUF1573 domain-containing protein [Bacteroidota bacterium]
MDIGDDPDFIRLSLLDSIPATEISFENRIIDFGNVTSDTILTANFYFKNTGNHPLVIAYVHPDCSCTNFSIREDTIEPKENSLISVEFNTFGRYGYQTIFATLACNSQERFHLLSLKCNITE